MNMKTRIVLVGLLFVSMLLPSLLCSCATTGGTKIQFEAVAKGVLSTGAPVAPFTNKKGWSIKLDTAQMLLGPVYLYEGAPQVRLWQYLQPIKSAYAHAGHVDASGQKTLGEILDQHVIDLLKGEATTLGVVRGVAGQLDKAELQLLPPGAARVASGSIEQVKGATIYATGTATKDSDSRPFVLKLTVPDQGTMRVVDNISASVSLVQEKVTSGKLMIEVHVDTWLTNVDFATLTEQNDNKEYVLSESNAAILQGVRSRYSYKLSWR